MKVKDFIKVCYDKDCKVFPIEFLYFFGAKKRKISQKIIDTYGFPSEWLGKTPAFTKPLVDNRTFKIVNRNHMLEDLVFVDLETDMV